MGTFIERLSDISKPFLASSVPYVECDLPPVVFDPLDFEINTNSTKVVSLKSILAVSYKQAGLSDSAVAHDQVLESDILLVAHY